jgi:hypothetical protein
MGLSFEFVAANSSTSRDEGELHPGDEPGCYYSLNKGVSLLEEDVTRSELLESGYSCHTGDCDTDGSIQLSDVAVCEPFGNMVGMCYSVMCPYHHSDEAISLDGCTLQYNYNMPLGYSWSLSPCSCICSHKWWNLGIQQCCKTNYATKRLPTLDNTVVHHPSMSTTLDDWCDDMEWDINKVDRRKHYRSRRDNNRRNRKPDVKVVRSPRGYYFARKHRKRTKFKTNSCVPNSGDEQCLNTAHSKIPGVEWGKNTYSLLMPKFDLSKVSDVEMEKMEKVLLDLWLTYRTSSWYDAILSIYRLIVDMDPSYSIVHLQHHIDTIIGVAGNFSITYNEIKTKCKDLSVNALIDMVSAGMRGWSTFLESSLGKFLTVIGNYFIMFATNPMGMAELTVDNLRVFLYRVRNAKWNSKDAITWLWEMTSDVLNTVKAYKETGSFVEALTRNSPYMRAYEEYMRVVGLYDMYNNGNLELIAKMTESDYEVLVRQTRTTLADFRPLVDARMRITLDRALNDLTAKHNKIIERLGMSGLRVRPFTVLAMGQSKTGKSFLMQKLVPLLLHLNGFKNGEEYIGTVDEQDKYFSTFKPYMTALEGDDICNFYNGNVTWSEMIIRFVNNHPHVLNKAEISEKGRVWMLIKLFFMTTNVPSLDILENVREHSAVMSRINVAYVQRVKREYQTTAVHNGHTVYGPGLDDSKLPPNTEHLCFPDIYEFDIYEVETYASSPVGVKLTFSEAVREHAPDHWRYKLAKVGDRELANVGIAELISYLSMKSTRWYAKQAALLKNVRNMDRNLGCLKCRNAIEHCTCNWQCSSCGAGEPLMCACPTLYDRATGFELPRHDVGGVSYVGTSPLEAVSLPPTTMIPTHLEPMLGSAEIESTSVPELPGDIIIGSSNDSGECGHEEPFFSMPGEGGYESNSGHIDVVDEFRHSLRDYLFNRVDTTINETRGIFGDTDGVMQIKSIMLLEKLFKRVRNKLKVFSSLAPLACIDVEDRLTSRVLLANVPVISDIRDNVNRYNSLFWSGAHMCVTLGIGFSALRAVCMGVINMKPIFLVTHVRWSLCLFYPIITVCKLYTQSVVTKLCVQQLVSYHHKRGWFYWLYEKYKAWCDWYKDVCYWDMDGVLDVVIQAKDEIMASDNEYAKTFLKQMPVYTDRAYKIMVLKIIVDALKHYRLHLGLVATGGYEVDQEAAIAKAHKYADMSYITAYQSNIDECPNSADINEGNLLQLLHKQVYKIRAVDESKPSFAVATAIKSNVLMTVAHGLRDSVRYEVIRKPILYDERGGVITKNAVFRFTFYKSSVLARSGDVCVFYCPKVGPVKDLTKFMPTIIPNRIQHVTAVYRDRHGVIGEANGRFNYAYRNTTLHACDYSEAKIFYDGFDYTAKFGYVGMSGSPIITPTNPACIVAIHVGAKDVLNSTTFKEDSIRGWPHTGNWIRDNISHVCVEDSHMSALQVANSGALRRDIYGKRALVHGISQKSIMYRMEPGEYLHYGRSPALVSFNDLDGVRPTLLAEHLEEYCGMSTRWDAPRLRGPEGDDNQAKWLFSLKYSTHTSDMIPIDIVDWAVEDYLAPLLAICQSCDKHEYRPLGREEVVNGRTSSKYMSAMTMSTSTGPPLNAPKSRYARQYNSPTGLRWAWSTDMFEKEADRMEGEYVRGNNTYPIFGVFPKIEPTIVTKSKVRLVQSAPIALQLVARKYLLPIIAFLCDNRFVSESMLGINPYGSEWEDLHSHVSQFGESRMGAMDYSKYDLRVSSQITLASYRVMYEIARGLGYTPDALAVIKGLATDMCYPVLDIAGEILQMRGMGPSGSNDTTLRNCICNSIYNRVWYFISHQRMYNASLTLFKPKLEPFRRYVALATYGDDNGFGVSRKCNWFDMVKIAEIAREFDVILTPANKVGTVHAFATPHEVAHGFFLKRGFRKEGNRIYAPLDEQSIFKRLYAINKPKPPNTVALITMDNIESALDEWSLHGDKVYTVRRDQIGRLLHDKNLFSNRIRGLQHTYEDKLLMWKKRIEQSGFRVDTPYHPLCDEAEG